MTQPMPRSMPGLLADLADACNSLGPYTPGAVACPVFGNAPLPAAPPTAGLPPMLAQASADLARALREPPRLGDQWPFADPPGLVAARAARQAAEKARGGRPSPVRPHQVVRLVRFVKLGDSITAAAKKCGLTHQAASRVLSGQSEVAHHPAVKAAGVFLPAQRPAETPPKPRQGPERHPAATTPAENTLPPLKSPRAPESRS